MKKKYLMTFIICMFIFVIKVNATSSISCKPTNVTVGEQITCSIKTDEPVEITTKLNVVAGDTTMEKDGNIVFNATAKGTYDVVIKTITPGFSDKVSIVVNEKTTTTKTTTTTTKAKSDNNYLSSITVDGKEVEGFSKSKTKYFAEVSNDVKKVSVSATAEDEASTIKVDGPKSLEVGDNEFTISVTSESNTTKFYKVIVTRLDEVASSNTDVKSIKIKGYHFNFDKNSKTFYVTIDKEDTELDIKVNLSDKKANYDIEDNENLKDGSVIKIVVTAENKDTDTYRIIVQKKKTNYLPIIIGGILCLVVFVIITFVVLKNKKGKNNKKDAASNKGPKEKVSSNSAVEEKTIEMTPISDEEDTVQDDFNTDDVFDSVPIDNDEDEETRILSYAEREELEKVKNMQDDDLSSKIEEELDKTLLFNYDSELDENE